LGLNLGRPIVTIGDIATWLFPNYFGQDLLYSSVQRKNMLEILYHHAEFGGPQISHAATATKTLSFFLCLFVRHACDVALVKDGICVRDFALKTLEHRNSFDTVGSGLQFRSRVQLSPYATSWRHQKTPKSKNSKIWGFSCQRASE